MRRLDAGIAGAGLAGGEGDDFQIGHSGSQEKAHTLMIFWPRRQTGLVIMTTSEYADNRQIAQAVVPFVNPAPAAAAAE